MQPSLSWIVALCAAAVLVPGALLAARRGRSAPRPLPTDWKLVPRPVFSIDERRVYRQLRAALPHHVVLSKLPLVRFCQPSDPQETRYWFHLLGGLHVTFAVCSANGRVLAAIDLDTERPGSRRSLQVKQAVLNACRVRYLRCPADHLPSVPELQLLVPHTSATRGPQPSATIHEARDTLASTVATRRRERTALWQDSSIFQDSFFAPDTRPGEVSHPSGFGPLSATAAARPPAQPPATAPSDNGDALMDPPRYANTPSRH